MSPENEPTEEPISEYPYTCPECNADLGQPGAVIAWIIYPERLVGHIEVGESEYTNGGEAIKLALDKVEYNPSPSLQCADCGYDLENLLVEEIFLDPECEIEEDAKPEEEFQKK